MRSGITGFLEVLQHTPLEVTSAPPFSVIVPPLVTELIVISVAELVVTIGIVTSFVHLVKAIIPAARQIKNIGTFVLFIFDFNLIMSSCLNYRKSQFLS